ncbi:MAG: transposase family protein [Bacteroidales bacterium]|nr:transposase family protein [Bacteroidales bacterium]
MEIDIKYIRIQGGNGNAYLFTNLDVYTRRALVWDLAFTMKAERVKGLFERLIMEHLQL